MKKVASFVTRYFFSRSFKLAIGLSLLIGCAGEKLTPTSNTGLLANTVVQRVTIPHSSVGLGTPPIILKEVKPTIVYPANASQLAMYSAARRVSAVFGRANESDITTKTYIDHLNSLPPTHRGARSDVSTLRVVYVIRESVTTPITSFGHTFVKGTRERVIDAASGDLLSVSITGPVQ